MKPGLVSLHVESKGISVSGFIHGLVGPSGGGKTTIYRVSAGHVFSMQFLLLELSPLCLLRPLQGYVI